MIYDNLSLHFVLCDMQTTITLREITKNIVDLLIKAIPEKELTLQLTKPFQKDENSRTLLQIASFYGYDEVVTMLINRRDYRAYINLLDNNNESALDIACKRGNNHTAFLLMQKGAIVRMISYEIIQQWIREIDQEMEKTLTLVTGKQANLLLPSVRYGISQRYVYLKNMRDDIYRSFKKAEKLC